MAKKKKSKPAKKRMGASKESPVMQIVGTIVGAIAGRVIANKVTALNPKIMAAVQALGGGVLAWKSKSALLKGLGTGLAVNGAISAGQQFGLLNGIGYAGKYTIPFAADGINGYAEVANIGAPTPEYAFPQPSSIGASEVGSLIG
jgi:hypothetical protein